LLLLLFGLFVACQALTGLTNYYSSIFGGGYIPFTAHLNATQVVPPPTNTFGGAAACLLNTNSNPMILSCQIVHDVPNAVAISIRTGAPGTNGPAALQFSGQLFPAAETDFQLDANNYNSRQILNLLTNGLLSITVEVPLSNGQFGTVIRGQLDGSATYFSAMDGSQVIDDDDASGLSHSTSNALGVGLFYYDYPSLALRTLVYHDVPNYYKSGIYAAIAGQVGSLTIPFITSFSPIQQTNVLSSDEQSLLFYDYLYVLIPSVSNPLGDIRGQVTGGTNYVYTQVALLDQVTLNTNTQARGIALFAYDCANRILNYYVSHSVLGVKSIGLLTGNSRIFSLPNPRSPSVGTRILSTDQETNLFSGQLRIRIESNTFPFGEISGTITNTTYNYATILNGRQMFPPVTTSNSGAAVVQYLGNRNINFAVLVNLSNGRNGITSIEFHQGTPGTNGSFLWAVSNPSTATLLTKGLRVLDDTQLAALFNNQLYVLVRTISYPQGELRGQVTRLYGSQCAAFPEPANCRSP